MVEEWTTYTGWIVGVSVVSLLVGVATAPYLIARIPQDYFSHPERQRLIDSARHPVVRVVLLGLKNLLGLVLVVAGLVMLITPGQGLLTLAVGLMIMDYPGKFALERWLIQRPRVLRTLNWLRRKYKQPPLQPPQAKQPD